MWCESEEQPGSKLRAITGEGDVLRPGDTAWRLARKVRRRFDQEIGFQIRHHLSAPHADARFFLQLYSTRRLNLHSVFSLLRMVLNVFIQRDSRDGS